MCTHNGKSTQSGVVCLRVIVAVVVVAALVDDGGNGWNLGFQGTPREFALSQMNMIVCIKSE